jgi:hypothetical protein
VNVRDMLEGMDSNELSEWLAYDNIYGLPDAYFVAGQVCATLVSVMTGKESNPADFVPFFRPQRRKQGVKDHMSIMRSIAKRGL